MQFLTKNEIKCHFEKPQRKFILFTLFILCTYALIIIHIMCILYQYIMCSNDISFSSPCVVLRIPSIGDIGMSPEVNIMICVLSGSSLDASLSYPNHLFLLILAEEQFELRTSFAGIYWLKITTSHNCPFIINEWGPQT